MRDLDGDGKGNRTDREECPDNPSDLGEGEVRSVDDDIGVELSYVAGVSAVLAVSLSAGDIVEAIV